MFSVEVIIADSSPLIAGGFPAGPRYSFQRGLSTGDSPRGGRIGGRALLAWLHLPFVIEGEAEQAVAAAQLQFGGDVLAVRFHGANAAFQQRGDLLAGAVLADELENLPFRGGEPVQTWFRRAQRGAAAPRRVSAPDNAGLMKQ